MIKTLIIPTVLFTLISCGTDFSSKVEQTDTNTSKQDNVIKTNVIQDTTHIKHWLTKVITDYVNNDDLKTADDSLRKALTEDYYNYKYEAISLEYRDMTAKEFHEKWKEKYDTKFVGTGGFFTSVGDNGKVEVTNCTLIKSLGETAKVFHTVIHDLRWKTDYIMDITVIYKDNKLLIDDVKEYK